tara:strand:- start:107 stop:256 length:150 start_codon:yes stop_codon:yes gene_type:complete
MVKTSYYNINWGYEKATQTAKTGFALIYIYSEFFEKIPNFCIQSDPFFG